MPEYLIEYHGGNPPTSKEEGQQQMENWKKWIESLGDAIVNPGTPLKQSIVLTSEGENLQSVADPMMGFAVIRAPDLKAAAQMASADPFLTTGGRIRLSEMMEMP